MSAMLHCDDHLCAWYTSSADLITCRVRYQVSSAGGVNFSQEATRLASILKQYSIDDNSMFVN